MVHDNLAKPNPRPAEDAAEWKAFDHLAAVQAASEAIVAKYSADLTEWLDTDAGAQTLAAYEVLKVAAYRAADAIARQARDVADARAREVGETHRAAYTWTHDRYEWTGMPVALHTGASDPGEVDRVEAFWDDVAEGGDGRVPAAGFITLRRNPHRKVVTI